MIENAYGQLETVESNASFSESHELAQSSVADENALTAPKRLLLAAPAFLATREKLIHHPLYAAVGTLQQLRVFMEQHVFAVWDFMSLTKRLQRDLTCVDLPWMPAENAFLARFINEIVHCEESDVSLDGSAASHLEMYLAAMEEVGANTAPFKRFMTALQEGQSLADALNLAEAPEHVQRFVLRTIDIAQNASKATVTADFLYGREDIIPDMFERILKNWDENDTPASLFAYYLERHIEMDGDNHGPAGRQMLITIAGESEARWQQAGKAAVAAMEARIALWDGVQASLAQN